MIAIFLGISKASSVFFCPHCYITSRMLQKGTPHFLATDQDVDNLDGGDQLRTVEKCIEDNERYIAETGGDKKLAKHYNNCISPPLIGDTGDVIDQVSTTPLHVSLGIGLKSVNLLEQQALELDTELKGVGAVHSEAVSRNLERRRNISQDILRIESDDCQSNARSGGR